MVFPAQGGRMTSIGGMNRTIPISIKHFGKKRKSSKKTKRSKSKNRRKKRKSNRI